MAVIGIAALVGVLIVASLAAQLLGVRVYRITSGSMEPTIVAGETILTRSTAADDLVVGDIVTTQRRGSERTVTHRIVRMEVAGGERVLWLQGDANPNPDPAPYTVSQVHRYVFTLF